METLILPRGVSGFGIKNQKELSVSDLKKAAEAITEQLGFEMDWVDGSSNTNCTYHFAILYGSTSESKSQKALLIHKFFPLAALVKFDGSSRAEEQGELNEFIFSEASARLVGEFHLFSGAFLNHPADGDDPICEEVLQLLSNEEFAEFAYYEPRCLGDIIFNNWIK